MIDLPERGLWAAVLWRAVEDALGGASGRHAALEQAAAIAWFRTGGADFHFVCEAAGYDPNDVRRCMLMDLDRLAQGAFSWSQRLVQVKEML